MKERRGGSRMRWKDGVEKRMVVDVITWEEGLVPSQDRGTLIGDGSPVRDIMCG